MPYLPPFNAMRAMVRIDDVQGKLTVSASYEEFLDLIRAVLSVIEVDDAWYLEKYPDVAEAIKAGKIKSAREHFMSNGYFEGRLPFPIKIEERWYLTQIRCGGLHPRRTAGLRTAAFRS